MPLDQLLTFVAQDNSVTYETIVLLAAIGSFMFTLSKARLITAKKDEIYSDLSRDFAKDVQERNDVLFEQNQNFMDRLAEMQVEIADIRRSNEKLKDRVLAQEKLIAMQSATIKEQNQKMEAMQLEINRIQRQNLEYRAGINILYDQVTEAGIEPRYRPCDT